MFQPPSLIAQPDHHHFHIFILESRIMAELAAIALAGNILQFLEVGIKLTRTATRVYQSTDGFIKEDRDFLADTERSRKLAYLIHQNQWTPEEHYESRLDDSLMETAKICEAYASELVALLDPMRLKSGGFRGLQSIKISMLRQFKARDVRNLEVKMIAARDNLMLALISTSYVQQSSALSAIRQLKQQNAVLEANTTSKLESIENLIQGVASIDADGATTMITHLDNLATEAKQVKRQHKLLKSLRFPTIRQRHSAIMEHHKATFQWIFTSTETGFGEWLESGDGFFWVKGKAGSGKSTLMKFLATHDETEIRLKTWGKGQKVVTASHFFWNAGTPMQKSLTGLFQTILYQVVKVCPELIDMVIECRKDPSDLMLAEPWDDDELRIAFQRLSNLESLPLHFCFFIDGLDEYTAGKQRYTGTFEELLAPLRVLVSSPSIKLCVSSRPWNSFDKEFGRLEWQLQLEDLTREDIRSYVTEQLGADQKFQELSNNNPQCSEIPETIVQRAQGVFLWVFLVVNSLLRGLCNDDSYTDLQQRLNELPDDLYRYFEHMLYSIEKVYWDNTTRIFRTVLVSEQSLPLLSFEFLDREVDDPAYAITMQSQPLSKERYKRIHQRAKTRLNARCRDLLYVTKNTGEAVFLYQVDFVHRTARDFFLDTGVIDKIIQQRPTQDFNPHLSLCKVMLALTKALTNFQSISTFVADLMYYARTIEDMYGQPDLYRDTPISFGSLTEMFGILDELARVNTERSVNPDVHLLDNLEHLSKDYFKKPRLNNVLAPAVQAGLLLYVEDRLRRHPSELQLNTGRPLLDYALRPGNIATMLRSPSETVPIIPILKLLLHLGANPNARVDMYDGKTTWGCFLETCQQHAARKRSPEEVEKIAAALELMIDYGARVEGHFGPLTFMELLDEINLPPHWVNRIQEMTENKDEKQSLLSSITSWLQWT
ncbi:hypothetical protein BFJ71_g13060 [Fusarium oxysporum]|nr:hypothetical protein BFJ71_g13060 [Fusarium oxysporum]